MRCEWCDADLPDEQWELFRVNGRHIRVCYGWCRRASTRRIIRPVMAAGDRRA